MITPHPQEGSFRLFKFRDIQVSVHWSWLLVAWFQIQRTQANREYPNPIWAVYEYLALFGIVLLHEFGHSLATRQVGGRSDNIILWPFGGIAYVQAPPRPGAHLWSIAAGPLVNVALIPVFWILCWWSDRYIESHAVVALLNSIFGINLVLLIFNVLPIYPLDGGQILQALLWYRLGYARALLIASGVGIAGTLALAIWLFSSFNSIYLPLMLLFLLINAWSSFQRARQLLAQGPPQDS
ncbi:MAG: peptidase M50 [Verrucomicrobiaceae bacterium]|nr:MAG: peptidase M50 [Verrucomicrobiaceae bacterium]